MRWLKKLLPLQVKALDFLIDTIGTEGGAGLFGEQRTGKTLISLAFLEHVSPAAALIVAPLTSIETVWAERLRETFPDVKLCMSWAEYKSARHHGPCFLLIHWQAFFKLAKRTVMKKQPWDVVLLDESQGTKHRASQQSRAARLLRRAKRRLALSGTPIDKSPIDLFAQMRFIAPEVLGESWGDFTAEYCYRAGFMGKKWEFKRKRLPRLLEVLEPYCFRLSLDQFDVPRPIFHVLPVSLLGEQGNIYRDMEEHSMVDIDGKIIKADLPVTKKLRLEQITGGFINDKVIDDEDREVENVIEVGRAKQRKFKWLIKRLKPPIVVSCKFLWEIESLVPILRERRWRVGVLTGKVKDKKQDKHRTWLLKDFQAGKLDAMVLQVRTGGVSVDLFKAQTLVIFSMNHSQIDFSQLVARLQHIAKTEPVEVWVIVAENTVDEDIRTIVKNKVRDAYEVVSHFQKEFEVMKRKEANGKSNAKSAKASARTKVKAAAESQFKFGIEALSKKLGISTQATRLKCRNNGVKKPKGSKSYGWDSQAEVDAAAKKCQAA